MLQMLSSFLFEKILFLSLAGSAATLLTLALLCLFGRLFSASAKRRLLIIPIILFLVPLGFHVDLSAPAASPESPAAVTADADNAAQEAQETPVKEETAQTTATLLQTLPAAERSEDKAAPDLSEYISFFLAALPFLYLFSVPTVLLIKCASIARFKLRLKKIAVKGENSRNFPRVRYFDAVSSPFVSGVFRPVIFMPLCMSEEEYEMALRHEITHIKRGDLFFKALCEIVTTLHFFNPFAYLLRLAFDRVSELACDEAVTRTMELEARKDYGRMLLTLMKKQRLAHGAACLSESRNTIERRIEVIMKQNKRRAWVSALSLFLALTFAFGTVALANGIQSASQAQPPKAVYSTENLYNIGFVSENSDNTEYLSTKGEVAVYTNFLNMTKFELSFFARPLELLEQVNSSLEQANSSEDYDALSEIYESDESYSDYYELTLTKINRRYGEGRFIEGAFTLLKNGEVYFENATGYLENLPPDNTTNTYPVDSELTVFYEKDGENNVFTSSAMRFVQITSEEALFRRTAQKDFELSPETRTVRLGKMLKGTMDGKDVDVSQFNAQLDDSWREEWENELSTVTYNVGLNEAAAGFSLVNENVSFNLWRGDKAECTDDTVKGSFRKRVNFGSYASVITDMVPMTISGLTNAVGETVTFTADDNSAYFEFEIVPNIEEPLHIYGTRDPEEFYTEGEAVFIGTPKEQDAFDLVPHDYVKRIIVDDNGKVLAVVPLEYQMGYLNREEGKTYSEAPTYERLFYGKYVTHRIGGSDSTEEKAEERHDMLLYDMATWWIRVIIPADLQYYVSE